MRTDGISIGVLTNGEQDQQLDKLRVIGLTELVDVVCTSDGIGVAKPDPRAFAILRERLHTSPERLVFLGDDADHDVAGARAAGSRAGLVVRSGTPKVGLQGALDTSR